MAVMRTITVACVFLCFALLDSAQGRGSVSRMCCTTYTRSPIPFHRIIGYKNQTILENCDIDAIIFYTVKKKICTTIKDEWVQRALILLSGQLKKMAKVHPVAGKHLDGKKSDQITSNPRGGTLSTTESSQNITEAFNQANMKWFNV